MVNYCKIVFAPRLFHLQSQEAFSETRRVLAHYHLFTSIMSKPSNPNHEVTEVVEDSEGYVSNKVSADKSPLEVKQHAVLEVEELSNLAEPDKELRSPWLWARQSQKPADLNAIATQRSVYDDPALVQFYFPRADHENLKAFDIGERWTYNEENKVKRKTDIRIFLWILVMFFALNIDRGNLGNAVADNLLDDLNLSTDDYNNAQNMYRIGFLISEIPSQMIGKKNWARPVDSSSDHVVEHSCRRAILHAEQSRILCLSIFCGNFYGWIYSGFDSLPFILL